MFALETMTKFKIKKFDTLSDKDREPGEKHGLQVVFGGGNMPADLIAIIDGAWRQFLFAKKPPKQAPIDGMESEGLTPAGSKIGVVSWHEEFTGYTLVIDYGMGDKSNIVLTDCKVSGLKFRPKEGSAWEITRLIVESPNATKKIIGEVGVLKSCEVSIQLIPPTVGDEPQSRIDDTKPASKPPKAKGKSATDEFVDRNTAGAAAAH